MFRCVNGKACEGTRSRERREYLKSVKRIGAALAASIVNGRYPGRKRQLAGTKRGVRAVLDQQGKNDRKQNGEKKPSFHGGECGTGIPQVNSGSQVGLGFKKMRGSGHREQPERFSDLQRKGRSVRTDVHGAEAVAIRRQYAMGHMAAVVDIADTEAEAAEVAMMESTPAPAAQGLGRCGGGSKGCDAERSRRSQYDRQFA